MPTAIETLDDAIEVWARHCRRNGLVYQQPANNSEYEPGRGWVLENIRGELAVVHEDGTVE